MPHGDGVGVSGGDVATTEAQVVVVVSSSGDERRGDYGDGAENEEEEAGTVQGSKEGTEELLRKVVYSEEAAYELYCDYGHRMGFSIRKGKQSYFTGTKRIRTKDYFCSKEVLKEGEKLTDTNFNDPPHQDQFRKVVYSEEAAYELYCDYGHRMGFSIRKGKQSYFTGTKWIRTKDYFCSKEVLKEGEKLTDTNFNDPPHQDQLQSHGAVQGE